MHEVNRSSHCTQCGKNIPGSSRFCDQCGSPVMLTVQPIARQQTARRSHAGQLTVILVIVALFGVVIFLVALSKQGTSTDTVGTNNSTQNVNKNAQTTIDTRAPGIANQPAAESGSLEWFANADEFARNLQRRYQNNG